MSDRYQSLIHTPVGQLLAKNLGLPNPVTLERWVAGRPVGRRDRRGVGGDGRLDKALTTALDALGIAHVRDAAPAAAGDAALQGAGLRRDRARRPASSSSRCSEFFTPLMRSLGHLRPRGRARHPARVGPRRRARRPACPGGLHPLAGQGDRPRRHRPARLRRPRGARPARRRSPRPSASCSPPSPPTSPVRWSAIGSHGETDAAEEVTDWARPLAGKVALVTGASRGIGEQIARVLHRDGATVLGIDVPQAASELQAVTGELGGDHLTLDITGKDAPQRIAQHVKEKFGGVDIVVHNAGHHPRQEAGEHEGGHVRLHDRGQPDRPRADHHRAAQAGPAPPQRPVVGVASTSGIAGNIGQTNYATSKAGVIGLVDSLADDLPDGITVNAVAPGFIETKMTAAVPFATREVGRRLNAMSQGGLPGRRRRDRGLVRQPRLDRRQRQRGAGLRPDDAGGLTRWRPGPASRGCSTRHRPPCR